MVGNRANSTRSHSLFPEKWPFMFGKHPPCCRNGVCLIFAFYVCILMFGLVVLLLGSAFCDRSIQAGFDILELHFLEGGTVGHSQLINVDSNMALNILQFPKARHLAWDVRESELHDQEVTYINMSHDHAEDDTWFASHWRCKIPTAPCSTKVDDTVFASHLRCKIPTAPCLTKEDDTVFAPHLRCKIPTAPCSTQEDGTVFAKHLRCKIPTAPCSTRLADSFSATSIFKTDFKTPIRLQGSSSTSKLWQKYVALHRAYNSFSLQSFLLVACKSLSDTFYRMTHVLDLWCSEGDGIHLGSFVCSRRCVDLLQSLFPKGWFFMFGKHWLCFRNGVCLTLTFYVCILVFGLIALLLAINILQFPKARHLAWDVRESELHDQEVTYINMSHDHAEDDTWFASHCRCKIPTAPCSTKVDDTVFASHLHCKIPTAPCLTKEDGTVFASHLRCKIPTAPCSTQEDGTVFAKHLRCKIPTAPCSTRLADSFSATSTCKTDFKTPIRLQGSSSTSKLWQKYVALHRAYNSFSLQSFLLVACKSLRDTFHRMTHVLDLWCSEGDGIHLGSFVCSRRCVDLLQSLFPKGWFFMFGKHWLCCRNGVCLTLTFYVCILVFGLIALLLGSACCDRCIQVGLDIREHHFLLGGIIGHVDWQGTDSYPEDGWSTIGLYLYTLYHYLNSFFPGPRIWFCTFDLGKLCHLDTGSASKLWLQHYIVLIICFLCGPFYWLFSRVLVVPPTG